ncbi:MAG: hypothetical protein FWF44_11180 [Defluviitaleaceae bacterium]|nr:hypothetical protein [Defluviitaleaceae bacterium]
MSQKSKFIEGVRPLQQFMDDGSFLMPEIPAVFRVLQALCAPDYIDYDYLLSVSGMAVRLAWQQGWAAYGGLPNQGAFPEGDGLSVAELALQRAGAGYTARKMADVGPDTAGREIKASLDREVPVLLWGGPHVCTAVLGYDGEELFGVSTFADQNRRIAPYGYNQIENWREKAEAYILPDSFAPKPMDEALLGDVLRTAARLARVTHVDRLGDTAFGTASFDAVAELMVWDENFEPLTPGQRYEGELSFPYERPAGYYRTDGARTLGDRFWAGYCDFLCMLNGYANFSRFLDKYADVRPDWSEALREASRCYFRACDYSGALWSYVTPDDAGVAKFREPEVRYAFAAHMLRAKIYTIRAVEAMERVISGQ